MFAIMEEEKETTRCNRQLPMPYRPSYPPIHITLYLNLRSFTFACIFFPPFPRLFFSHSFIPSLLVYTFFSFYSTVTYF